MYSSYSPNRWYWDAIIGLRKAFIAFLTSYISLPQLEIHYTIVVLVLYIVMNEYGKPYSNVNGVNTKRGDSLQQLDTLSLMVCLFTAWSGMFFVLYPYCNEEDNMSCYILMWLVFSLNVSFLLYCASLFRKKMYNADLKHSNKKYTEATRPKTTANKKNVAVNIEMNRASTIRQSLSYRSSFVRNKKLKIHTLVLP